MWRGGNGSKGWSAFACPVSSQRGSARPRATRATRATKAGLARKALRCVASKAGPLDGPAVPEQLVQKFPVVGGVGHGKGGQLLGGEVEAA